MKRLLPLLAIGGVIAVGCDGDPRPKGERHTVHKPIEWDSTRNLPIVINFPDMPEVPEAIRGPSPPIEEQPD